jgi:hypothetical protein
MENYFTFLLAPTITGVKPSSIITIKSSSRQMYNFWINYGCEYLGKLNLSSRILRSNSDCITLIIFNSENLKQHISLTENREFLYTFGYKDDLDENLIYLCKRFKNFIPHECGIFLGIPREDVEGYMSGKECILCGYWKVYNDCQRVKNIFEAYDKAKVLVMENVMNNKEFNDYYNQIINIYKTGYM